MKDFNTISLYGCPMEPMPKLDPPWEIPNSGVPATPAPSPNRAPPQSNTHVAHALLRLYGFALEGAKQEQHNELTEHFRTLGKALGVM